jgi:hypothetical protein
MNINKASLIPMALALTVSFRSASAFARPVRMLPAKTSASSLGLFNKLFSTITNNISNKYPLYADDSIMSKKAHGTSAHPVQTNLKWACDGETADRICNFNRHYAERSGYWESTDFLTIAKNEQLPINFYDSVTGKRLFSAPIGRSWDDFVRESRKHGWPSFRDAEVDWDNVRCLRNGECVSVTGTHLGHNLPDATGNRYCINLVSVAGNPQATVE